MRHPSRAIVVAAFGTFAASFLAAGPGQAMEEWQIGAGPFVSASDVRAHNKMPLDIEGVVALIGAEEPDWQGALELFAFGENFPNHSLARFTDNYNGRFPDHLSTAVALFGAPGFQNHALSAALIGTGGFAAAEPAERRAFVEAGLQAVAINWARYELGESARKAQMAEPNWSLENGSPKNWNEIFAFWWGPEGRHSAFEAVEAVEGGPAVNAALLQALADGQAVLLTETWAEAEADRVATVIDDASVLLLANALAEAAEADAEALPAARARAAGYWLAAGDAIGDAPAAAAVTAALDAAEPAAFADALGAVRGLRTE